MHERLAVSFLLCLSAGSHVPFVDSLSPPHLNIHDVTILRALLPNADLSSIELNPLPDERDFTFVRETRETDHQYGERGLLSTTLFTLTVLFGAILIGLLLFICFFEIWWLFHIAFVEKEESSDSGEVANGDIELEDLEEEDENEVDSDEENETIQTSEDEDAENQLQFVWITRKNRETRILQIVDQITALDLDFQIVKECEKNARVEDYDTANTRKNSTG